MRDSVRHLSKGVAIYGAGDAAIQVVRLLLLAVYVKGNYLVAADYGALAIIIGVEAIAKIVSRWGLDGAFMRFYHERARGGPLEQLASTIVWFTISADAVVFSAALAASAWLGPSIFANPTHLTAFQLMLLNTFLLGPSYVPYHVMRLQNQALAYSGFTFARSIGTVAAQIAFVIGLGWGLAGWVAADIVVTVLLFPFLWRWMGPLVQRRFSREDLRVVLLFGLPRLPHGMAQQGLEAGNKFLMNSYTPLGTLGVYQNGFTLGTAIRFFTSAFETAWAPFYYAQSRKDGAPAVFAKMTTYGVAVLALLVALTVAVAKDVVLVALTPEYLEAVPVIPIIAIAMAVQGVYLLTSIGLNLTSQTKYYPMATFAALAVGLGAGLVLMPRFALVGAAAAFLLSAVTQTAVAFAFARRVYPVPYEVGRLARVVAAGALAGAVGVWAIPEMHPLASLFVRASATTSAFVVLLAASGFLRRTERAFLAEMLAALRRRGANAEGRLQ